MEFVGWQQGSSGWRRKKKTFEVLKSLSGEAFVHQTNWLQFKRIWEAKTLRSLCIKLVVVESVVTSGAEAYELMSWWGWKDVRDTNKAKLVRHRTSDTQTHKQHSWGASSANQNKRHSVCLNICRIKCSLHVDRWIGRRWSERERNLRSSRANKIVSWLRTLSFVIARDTWVLRPKVWWTQLS